MWRDQAKEDGTNMLMVTYINGLSIIIPKASETRHLCTNTIKVCETCYVTSITYLRQVHGLVIDIYIIFKWNKHLKPVICCFQLVTGSAWLYQIIQYYRLISSFSFISLMIEPLFISVALDTRKRLLCWSYVSS